MRKGGAPVLMNAGAEAWDLGDGVLGLTFKTKANSIDSDVIKMIHDATARAEQDFRAMVVWNQGEFFCVGANLFAVMVAAGQKQWDGLREMIRGYQYATQRMKYATVPVVAAPYNMTLGGGLELCFGADAVQAASETYAGLVEVGVGLIPGGGGTMNMLWRQLESLPEGADADVYSFVTQTFKNIALAKVATSAEEAKALGFFRGSDGVSFDRARQLHETKRRAIGLADAGYHPPTPRAYKLPGESGIATLQMLVNTLMHGRYASEHDALIARKLAVVLCRRHHRRTRTPSPRTRCSSSSARRSSACAASRSAKPACSTCCSTTSPSGTEGHRHDHRNCHCRSRALRRRPRPQGFAGDQAPRRARRRRDPRLARARPASEARNDRGRHPRLRDARGRARSQRRAPDPACSPASATARPGRRSTASARAACKRSRPPPVRSRSAPPTSSSRAASNR